MRVNLGCGNKILPGWVNLDKHDTYSVDVIRVNTSNQEGKVKRFKGKLGSRNNFKKAFVKIKKDQKINFQD